MSEFLNTFDKIHPLVRDIDIIIDEIDRFIANEPKNIIINSNNISNYENIKINFLNLFEKIERYNYKNEDKIKEECELYKEETNFDLEEQYPKYFLLLIKGFLSKIRYILLID